ncbi:MAG: Na/Pi cotransporter family protein [Planctomycetota bacterium]
MWTLFTIGGGVALILFAVRFLRKGLDRLFGARLGAWMNRLARSRWRGFLTGLGLSVVTPSSTSFSVLAVSAVKSSHLTARQALAVVLGANIGLTAMVLIIALRIESIAPVLVLMGVLMFQYMHNDRARGIGQTLLAVGFIFLGIGFIEQGVAGVRAGPNSEIAVLVGLAERHPLALLLLSAAIANVLQSSTATIALIIGLSATGAVTLPVGLVAVAGANLGTALTTIVIGWRDTAARQLASANFTLKLLVALGIALLSDQAAAVIALVPAGLDARIAIAHTAFNIVVALIGLTSITPLMHTAERLIQPNPNATPRPFGPRYLNEGTFNTPELVLGLSEKEILHAGDIVRHMLRDIWSALRNDDIEMANKVRDMDNRVDTLDGEIRGFLRKAMQDDPDLAPSAIAEHIRQLRYLNELENIGDIIDKNLVSLAIKKQRLRLAFTDDHWAELEDFYNKVYENLLIAERVFSTESRNLAESLLNHKAHLQGVELKLRDRRLKQTAQDDPEVSAVLLDLITNLKRINTHLTRVGYAALEPVQA